VDALPDRSIPLPVAWKKATAGWFPRAPFLVNGWLGEWLGGSGGGWQDSGGAWPGNRELLASRIWAHLFSRPIGNSALSSYDYILLMNHLWFSYNLRFMIRNYGVKDFLVPLVCNKKGR
jgi:hypothetical protein